MTVSNSQPANQPVCSAGHYARLNCAVQNCGSGAPCDDARAALSLSIEEAAELPANILLETLSADISSGLSTESAQRRLALVGPNELQKVKSRSYLAVFVDQFKSSVVVLLLVAVIVSFFNHEHHQAAAILAAVLINAVVGFATECRAAISLRALEELSAQMTRVRRSGSDLDVNVSDLVPGDLIILDPGVRVPADVRLVQTAGLTVDESILTGESVPVLKTADRPGLSSCAYRGTVVVSGRAKALVLFTGADTKLGKLGKQLSDISFQPTPLEKNLEDLGGKLSVLTVVLCAALFVIGYLCKRGWLEMMQTSIALAVAAIPEGLPVVATLALAIGTQRMVKSGALIRKLSAVETLGCTQIICTDKTGTLTENKMVVTDIVLHERAIQVSGSGYVPQGDLSESGRLLEMDSEPILESLLLAITLCNDARIENHDGSEEWHVHGDPTEGALIAAAGKAGMSHKEVRARYPRLAEIPFDMARKMMTTVHSVQSESFTAFAKGSPESILSGSSRLLSARGVCHLDDQTREWFEEQNRQLTRQGKRTLGIAMRELADHANLHPDSTEQNLIFLGLVAMCDQIKDGVREAVAACQDAGIRVIMLTGDQAATAAAIAEQLRIINPSVEGQVLTGSHYATLADDGKQNFLASAGVVARMSPDEKLSIVQQLQAAGKVVAMTGDGVNDAAALRQADIGIAMGKSGTALAREASSMVITDDNFATIVKAVKQGRTIHENISRAVAYLLTASVASVLTVFATVLIGKDLLSPLQLLWLNLIMHIFPALGIVLQSNGDRDVMKRPPRKSGAPLLSTKQIAAILWRASLVSVFAVLAAHLNDCLGSQSAGSSVLLSTLSIGLILQSLVWSSSSVSRRWLPQPCLAWNCAISGALLFACLYWTVLSEVLETSALDAPQLALVLAFSLGSYAFALVGNKIAHHS